MVTRSQVLTGIGAAVVCFVLIQGYLLFRAPRLHPIQGARQKSSAYNMLQEFVNHCDESGVHCILVDQLIFNALVQESLDEARSNFSPCKYFCRNHIYTFAVRERDFQLLKSTVLPGLKKFGYAIEATYNERVKSDIPTHIHLRYHENHAIHLVILHDRKEWWWYGPDIEDKQLLDFTKTEGALDAFEYDFKVTIDGIEVYMPHYPKQFINMYESSYFMPCNVTRTGLFYEHYPKDMSKNATEYRGVAATGLTLIKSRLDAYNVPFWISNGTLLGWLQQCDFIPYDNIDIGIFINDHTNDLFTKLKASSLAIEQKFGLVEDSLQFAYDMGKFKIVLSFFYEDKTTGRMWTGDTNPRTGQKFKYTFEKFTLCWTEMSGIKIRVPCETETYIKALYGKNWFAPFKNYDWRKMPPNVVANGKWNPDEWDEVIQLWNKHGKRITPELAKEEL